MPSFNQRLGITRYEADEYYRRGLEAYRKGDFDAAVDAMNDAIEALPNKSEYYAARGLIHLDDGEGEKARIDFEEALRLFKYEMLANYGMGVVEYKAGHWETALAYFLTAHYADQKRPETLYYLALTYFRQGDLVNATNYMVRANEAFEAANDKRKADAGRWLREFSRHLATKPTRAAALPNQQQMRLPRAEEE
jgi:tetratricopeptide (TPR) repeat protein